VVFEDIVYCSAGYGVGAGAVRIAKSGSTFEAKEIWRTENENINHWSTPVCVDGFLYGMFSFKEYGNGPMACVDIRTGERKWSEPGFGPGHVILTGGGRILALGDRGQLVLVSANPAKYDEIARRDILEGKCWSTPVLSNGRIYARSAKEAVCLDVSGKIAAR
jgi:outer membrane protein assembly factor BamB